jgi:hypothetical protein
MSCEICIDWYEYVDHCANMGLDTNGDLAANCKAIYNASHAVFVDPYHKIKLIFN